MKKVEYQVSLRMQYDATADVHRVFRWYAAEVVADRVENAVDAVLLEQVQFQVSDEILQQLISV